MNGIRIWMTLLMLLQFAWSSFAGWVISEESVDNYGNKSFQTTFIQQNRIRYESSTSVTILDLNDSTITIVFPTLMVYWKGNPDELNEEMFMAFEVQVQSLIAGLPQSEQPAFQQMYDSIKIKLQRSDTGYRVPPSLHLKKTAENLDVGIYHTTAYALYRDSIIKKEFWVASGLNPYEEVDIQRFISLNNRINPYSRRGIAIQAEEYLSLLNSGIIVKSRVYGGADEVLETSVVDYGKVNIPDDFFLPPANYRKVSLAEAFTLPMIDSELFNSE